MLTFAQEWNSQSKIPHPCFITKHLLSQLVEIDSDDLKSLTSKLLVKRNFSRKFDLTPREPITMKKLIAKYDALLVKALYKIESTYKQLENETKVFKTSYA